MMSAAENQTPIHALFPLTVCDIYPTTTTTPEDHDSSETKAIWHFTNTTSQAITLSPAPCHCRDIAIEPNPCPAGQSGIVCAWIPLQNHSGRIDIPIELRTDNPTLPTIQLTAALHLPYAPVLMPSYVRWDHQSSLIPQSISAILPAEAPFSLVAIHSADVRFQVLLSPGKLPRTWIITISPTSTATPCQAWIELIADNNQHFRISARVL